MTVRTDTVELAPSTSLKIGILVSGTGSNMAAIAAACGSGSIDAEIALVLSNRPRAAALRRAQEAGLPTAVVSHRGKPSREAFETEMVERLETAGAQWIVMAGFMRILGRVFLSAFPGRVLNIHPSLLPAFPGTGAVAQALEHGVKFSGCTVHLVDSGVDTGPIIAQAVVPVLPDDTEQSLGQRIRQQEHRLYPLVLRRIASGTLRVAPRLVGVEA